MKKTPRNEVGGGSPTVSTSRRALDQEVHGVVLMNLGGPLSLEGVEEFLFNLFYDPAIINLPNPLRRWIAKFAARRRAVEARKIYAKLGGSSPLLANTRLQAQALEAALNAPHPIRPDGDKGERVQYKVVIAMRYAPPRAQAAVEALAEYNPSRLLLVPLYPQFSTTTTGSSLKELQECLDQHKTLSLVEQKILCCYPTLPGFVAAQGQEIIAILKKHLGEHSKRPRLLYSAHGLPEKIVTRGDPYPDQVRATVDAVNAYLGAQGYHCAEDFDYVQCYQSKVGPVSWIKPATEDEIARAGQEGVPLVVVPISFVSEHSETLVELDDEYRELAKDAGVPTYHRVPTVMAHKVFVDSLAVAIKDLDEGSRQVRSVSPDCCRGRSCLVCPLYQADHKSSYLRG